MSRASADDREYAAALARRYFYERSVTCEFFVETFSTTTDPLISEMVDLVANEPLREGMLGARYDQYVKHYWPAVAAVLHQLERGEAGVLPPRGRFSVGKLLVFVLLAMLVGASAAEHILAIVHHLRGSEVLRQWPLLGHTFGAVVMSGLLLMGIMNVIGSSRLYWAERKRRAG